jgi:hypothetical protein
VATATARVKSSGGSCAPCKPVSFSAWSTLSIMGTRDPGAGLTGGLGEKVRPRVEGTEGAVSAGGSAGATSADWDDVAAAP